MKDFDLVYVEDIIQIMQWLLKYYDLNQNIEVFIRFSTFQRMGSNKRVVFNHIILQIKEKKPITTIIFSVPIPALFYDLLYPRLS